VADPNRAREHYLRVHQSVLQSRTEALRTQLRNTPGIRRRSHSATNIRLKLVTSSGNQTVGQVSHLASGKIATVSVAVPKSRFGPVEIGDHDNVIGFHEKPDSDSPMSMAYFVLGPAVFDLFTKESVLEEEPLAELARRDKLSVYRHGGFWQPMDTYREYQALNAL